MIAAALDLLDREGAGQVRPRNAGGGAESQQEDRCISEGDIVGKPKPHNRDGGMVICGFALFRNSVGFGRDE